MTQEGTVEKDILWSQDTCSYQITCTRKLPSSHQTKTLALQAGIREWDVNLSKAESFVVFIITDYYFVDPGDK